GDFTTAPEISQIFGELIGAWLIDAWQTMGSPSLFNLVELGPGRGTLMADILRVGQVMPPFINAARIYMLETSGRLRVKQQRVLDPWHDRITWIDQLEDIPAAPTLLVANEFFDCLPIRQFVRTADVGETPWRERLVGHTPDGKSLCFVLSEEKYSSPPGAPSSAKPEDIFEYCAAGEAVVLDLAERLKAHKGRMLIIDYGHGRPGFGDTFQAVKRHDYWHPLASPGLADITAHVDFSALARAGRAADIRVDGPVRQGDFLNRLGLQQRLEVLCHGIEDDNKRADIQSGAGRLSDPDAMGTLFKVLSLSSPGFDEPPGFS
ncbi:MAG: SAM-dependent methyltransferase, partial [Pseudomonadota bacterium]